MKQTTRIISLLLVLSMVCMLNACGNESTPASAPVTPEVKQYNLTPALEAFVYFAERVGKLSYEESVKYTESIGLSVEKTAPTKDVTGTLTAQDGDNELYVAFYPNSQEVETIMTVDYSGSEYGISADDGYHLYSVGYKTFDRNHDPHRTDVAKIDDLIVFAFEHLDIPSADGGSTLNATSSGEATAAEPQKPVNTPKPAETTIQNPYSGSYDATLDYGGESVLICADEASMDRYMTALGKNDRDQINEMIMAGEIAFAERGIKCNIIKSKATRVQVELLEGIYSGNTVWVVIEAVQK